MLELRLRQHDQDAWATYELDRHYQLGEVECYIERQSRMKQPVRLMTSVGRPVDFTPSKTVTVQLLCR